MLYPNCIEANMPISGIIEDQCKTQQHYILDVLLSHFIFLTIYLIYSGWS